MKAYLIFDTDFDNMNQNLAAYARGIGRHIEIPEGATGLRINPEDDKGTYYAYGKSISIPRPKQKVKKWKWYVVEEDCITSERYTEQEAKAEFDRYTLFRIDPTEKEVEE